jgi:hypothetical protein
MTNLIKYDESKLYCFSPPVMLFTFFIEIIFALYILFTSKLKPITALMVGILVFLSIFQLAEFQVCSNKSLVWMRIGYVAITMLPPLGIHLIGMVTKRKWLSYLGYSLAGIFIITFLFSTRSLIAANCGGNYVMVVTNGVIASKYFPLYYYTMLFIGLTDIANYIKSLPNTYKSNQPEPQFLLWIMLGYLSFLGPTAAVYLLSLEARRGIPSIMCGFAVLLAVIIGLRAYPISKKLK